MAEKETEPKDLRALSGGELAEQLQTLRQELWTCRWQARVGALQKTHLPRTLRRQIARVQTMLSEQRRSAHA